MPVWIVYLPERSEARDGVLFRQMGDIIGHAREGGEMNSGVSSSPYMHAVVASKFDAVGCEHVQMGRESGKIRRLVTNIVPTLTGFRGYKFKKRSLSLFYIYFSLIMRRHAHLVVG